MPGVARRRTRPGLVFGALFALVLVTDALAISPEKQLSQLTIRRFGLEQGLPTVSIHALAQAPDGTLWIATGEGLVRFDGFEMKVFDRRNTPAFETNEVRSVAFDGTGTLWISMADYLVCRLREGRIETVQRLQAPPTWLRSGGRLFLGSGNELYRLDDRLVRLPVTTGSAIRGLALDRQGDTWISAETGPLERYRGTLRVDHELTTIGRDALLAEDGHGGFWAAEATGLSHVTEGKIDRQVPSVERDRPWALFVDSAGCAWSSSTQVTRVCGDRIERLDHVAPEKSRLMALLPDADGSVWIATWEAGLVQLADGPFSTVGRAQGLPADFVSTFLEAADGSLWVGSRSGVHNLGAKGTRSFGAESGLGNPWARALAEGPNGEFLVGTNEGLYCLSAGVFRNCSPEVGNRNEVYALYRDGRGDLWATVEGAVLRIRGSRVERLNPPEPTVFYAYIEDRSGTLWAASSSGIYRLDNEASAFRKVVTPLPASRPIFMSAALDRAGRLWFGSYQGGVLVGPPSGPFRLLTTRDGLPDDNVLGIVQDGQGRMWFTGGRRLVSIDESEIDAFLSGSSPRLTTRTYGRLHGVGTVELLGGAGVPAIRTKDGHLWFGTSAGALTVDPSALGPDRPPEARLSSLTIDDVEKPLSAALLVPPGLHRVVAKWSANHRIEPESVIFRQRLAGWNDAWQVGTERTTSYTRLEPGSYRLEVEASFDGKSWGATATAAIRVEAAWHQRRDVRFGTLLLLGVVAVASVRVRLARAKTQERRLEALVSERSTQLLREQGERGRVESELKRRREMEPLAEMGRRVAGLVDPETVLAETDKALSQRIGAVPRLLLASREGAAVIARGSAAPISPDDARDLLAALARVPKDVAVVEAGAIDSVPARERLEREGLGSLAPFRSGDAVWGLLAIGEVPAAEAEGLGEFLPALAAQSAIALEGAFQAAEAVRWRRLSDARVDWLGVDPIGRVVFAAVARSEGEVLEKAVLDTVDEAYGERGPSRERLRAALDGLVDSGVLERLGSGFLAVRRGDWLLLPELRGTLAEIARAGLMRVGAFRLLERIGAGGMGEVYRAVNAHDGSWAAVKLLYPADSQDPEARRRLEREGAIVAGLDHPGIVRLLERGEHEGRLYIAMELLEGEPLGARLDRGPLSDADARDLARQLLSALAFLHDAGVVHRDVNPNNIFCCRDGRFVLLDLGLARGLEHSTVTHTRQVLGTLPYMSPEQLRGENVDSRSDLWSFGVVLHEALSGTLPWDAPNTVRMALDILKVREALPLPAILGSALAPVVARCLQGAPDARGPDAFTLSSLLDAGSPRGPQEPGGMPESRQT